MRNLGKYVIVGLIFISSAQALASEKVKINSETGPGYPTFFGLANVEYNRTIVGRLDIAQGDVVSPSVQADRPTHFTGDFTGVISQNTPRRELKDIADNIRSEGPYDAEESIQTSTVYREGCSGTGGDSDPVCYAGVYKQRHFELSVFLKTLSKSVTFKANTQPLLLADRVDGTADSIDYSSQTPGAGLIISCGSRPNAGSFQFCELRSLGRQGEFYSATLISEQIPGACVKDVTWGEIQHGQTNGKNGIWTQGSCKARFQLNF